MTDNVSIEEYRDGVLVRSHTATVQRDPRTVDLRTIKADYVAARQNLVAAHTTLQAASTQAQLLSSVKAFATASMQVDNVTSRLFRYIDQELDTTP